MFLYMPYSSTIFESQLFSVQCLTLITADQCLTLHCVLSITGALQLWFLQLFQPHSTFQSRSIMKIMRCVKFIRCPIWLHSMLSNANLLEVKCGTMQKDEGVGTVVNNLLYLSLGYHMVFKRQKRQKGDYEQNTYTLHLYKNVVFSGQAQYFYFFLPILAYKYSCIILEL